MTRGQGAQPPRPGHEEPARWKSEARDGTRCRFDLAGFEDGVGHGGAQGFARAYARGVCNIETIWLIQNTAKAERIKLGMRQIQEVRGGPTMFFGVCLA